VAPRNTKKGTEDSKAYFRTNPPCPAFWGVAPPNMKTGSEDSKAYFRTKENVYEMEKGGFVL
jgi:hypothetical protein